MNFTINTKKFVELLDIAARFVARSSTLMILENVCLKTSNNTLQLIASDMEKYIDIQTPVNSVDWAITVNARTLLEFVKTIDAENVEVSVDMKTDFLHIKTENDNLKIKWISASEYVAVPSVESDNVISMFWADISSWISKVDFAIKDKHHMPIITGLLIRKKTYDWENKLVFVWTDAYKIAEYKMPLTSSYSGPEELEIIVPKVNIAEVQKVIDYFLAKGWENIEIKISESLVGFSMKIEDISIQITSILLKWSFPNYENESVMPTTFTNTISVSKDAIDRAIRKVGLLNRSDQNFVQLNISSDNILVDSGFTDAWEAKSKIVASASNTEETTLILNWKYLQDCLRVIQWDELTLNVVAPWKPLIVKDPAVPSFTYVVKTKSN